MMSSNLTVVTISSVAAPIPMGRPGRPEEIAGAVAWLLSEDASSATGTTLRITGGLWRTLAVRPTARRCS